MFAETETKIIERLVAVLPSGVHVGAMRDLERVPQMRQKAPAAWVIYDGYEPLDVITPTGGVQQIGLDWYVVLTTASAKSQGGVEAARDEAADLAEQTLHALLGFHLGGGKYLRLQPAPGPEYDAGYCLLPLAFRSTVTFKGQS